MNKDDFENDDSIADAIDESRIIQHQSG